MGGNSVALIPCPDCGKEVSDSAPSCPGCGRPIATGKISDAEISGKGEGIFMKSLNCGCYIVIFVILVVVFVAIIFAFTGR
jgi:uncharacterized membrane protein YvbJ